MATLILIFLMMRIYFIFKFIFCDAGLSLGPRMSYNFYIISSNMIGVSLQRTYVVYINPWVFGRRFVKKSNTLLSILIYV